LRLMKATALLLAFLHNGVQVWVEGDELCFQATKGALAPAPREELNRRQRLTTILGVQ
jgi:hypothetical protein